MIRFSAALVVVAIGILIGGVATSKLTLVYVAIAVSAVALVMLAIGVALKREELFGEGQVLSPAGAGDSPVFPVPSQNGPVAPQITPFPGSAAAPIAASGRGMDSGLSDAGGGAAGGGWDRTGHDRVGQPSAGEPARGLAAFGQSALGRPAFGQNQPRNPRSQDVRSDRDRDASSPWDATASGQDRSHDNAGRPPLPGRHSRNVGADDPWSPPAQAESGSAPESPSPFSSAPRRVPGATLGSMPGATLGNWFDQQAESDRQSQSAAVAGEEPAVADGAAADVAVTDSAAIADSDGPGESAATPSDPASGDALEEASASGTSTGSGWSGGGWAWSSPLTDDTAKSAVTSAPGDAVVSGDTAVPDAEEDDWPSRYSWLDDEETGKPEDVKPTSDPEPDEDASLDKPADMTDTDEDASDPSAEKAEDAGLVTVLPGVPRYHEGNCILIRFMPQTDVQHLTIPEAEKLGCTPCTACQTED